MTIILEKYRKPNHFEGFYVRLCDPGNAVNLALIWAATSHVDDPHAFIQVFDGVRKENTYHRFDADAFYEEGGTLHIGNNTLSDASIHIAVSNLTLEGTFKNLEPNRKSAMGFLRHFPLQCFQEVLHMNGSFEGSIALNNAPKKDFTASIYMEKTFGKRFPDRWFWLQANHFDDPSAMLSSAGGRVPLLFFRIFGFFALFRHKGKTYRFGSFKGSKIKISDVTDKKVVRFSSLRHTLIVEITINRPTVLKGPAEYGKMELDVHETIDSQVTLTLRKGSTTLFKGTSPLAGVEWMLNSNNQKE